VWLAENVACAERRSERVREELLKHLRQERIEPPAPGRISRIVASALHNAEVTWSVRIASRLSAETTGRIYALVGIDDGDQDDADGEDEGDAAVQDEVAGAAAAAPAAAVAGVEDDGGSGLLALIKSAPGYLFGEVSSIGGLLAPRMLGFDAAKSGRDRRGLDPLRVPGQPHAGGREQCAVRDPQCGRTEELR
jgi:hypothetical protein